MSNEVSTARRPFSSQDKVRIIKQHLVERTPVSDLCDRHTACPWQENHPVWL
ncbi:MAG: hypothetical protein BWZ02_00282 [Lentisphaerae bacterium ADurb.BinA184]|nr:MAG: hypothetical protein BWZ02_00282 [Lentisphaerae bacterium ADurb.BinA184]